MKRNNFLIKLIVLIVFVSMISCFMVGCAIHVPPKDVKSIQFYYSLKLDDRVFSIEEEVVLDLYFGCDYKRGEYNNIDLLNLDVYITSYSYETVSETSELKEVEKRVLLTLEDFCYEKYPTITYQQVSDLTLLGEPTLSVVIPKEMFSSLKGIIYIHSYEFNESGKMFLEYEKNGNDITIIHSKQSGEIEFKNIVGKNENKKN